MAGENSLHRLLDDIQEHNLWFRQLLGNKPHVATDIKAVVAFHHLCATAPHVSSLHVGTHAARRVLLEKGLLDVSPTIDRALSVMGRELTMFQMHAYSQRCLQFQADIEEARRRVEEHDRRAQVARHVAERVARPSTDQLAAELAADVVAQFTARLREIMARDD